jgi:hypothetical protein
VDGLGLEGLMVNVGKLFPGATVRTTGASDSGKWTERVITILNDSKAPAVTTGELGRLLRKPWRSLSSNVLMPAFLSVLAGMG